MARCDKHGLYSLFCRACDIDTIEQRKEAQMNKKTSYSINEGGFLTFPKSTFDQFQHLNKSLRWGQAFHGFMKLEKCTQDKVFANRLYNEPNDEKAKAMVTSRLDRNN